MKKKLTCRDEELPLWAIRLFRDLSKKTGIAFSEIRDAALGFGIYQLKSELAPVKTLLASARALASLEPDDEDVEGQDSPEEPPTDQNHKPAETTDDVYGISVETPAVEIQTTPGSAVSGTVNGSGLDRAQGTVSVAAGSDNVSEPGREQSEESVLDIVDTGAITGE